MLTARTASPSRLFRTLLLPLLPLLSLLSLLSLLTVALDPVGLAAGEEGRRTPDRVESLKLLCEALGVGAGAAVADIGCGRGHDSFVFAGVVGTEGTVYAEEIEGARVEDVRKGSIERGLTQVVPVLGKPRDPNLPDGSVDLIYMHLVFHHFSDPRGMLGCFLRDLKPGGFLAIADRQRGPLEDRVPLDVRQKSHHWTGETFVVRLALEAGFDFHRTFDDEWFEKDAFVLVFRRPPENGAGDGPAGSLDPAGSVDPAGSQDRVAPLDPARVAAVAGLDGKPAGTTLLVALDEGRSIVPLAHAAHAAPGHAASGRLLDVVLEEWAGEPDELPEHGGLEGARILRTAKGALPLPDDVAVDRAVFVDAYHRIWDPAGILARLRTAMPPGTRLVIVDRTGPDGEERRIAGHRRRVSPALVRADLERAGFRLIGEKSPPTPDRFVLIFAPGPSPAGSAPAGSERLF